MNEVEALPIVFRVLCSFLAAFPSIALWSRTRDAAWMLIVLGALFFFVDSLYTMLVIIGLATYELPFLPSIPLLESFLACIPFIFLASGFLVFLFRNRRY